LFSFQSSEIFRKKNGFSEFAKKVWLKKPCFGSKTGVLWSNKGVSKYSKFSKNYEKMTSKLNFKNLEKLSMTRIPTLTFEFKFGMQGITVFLDSSQFHQDLTRAFFYQKLETTGVTNKAGF